MPETKLKLCLAPMEILWGNKQHNLAQLEEVFEKIHPETDLIILPETFSTGFPSLAMQKEIANLAESNDGETLSLIRKLSQEKHVAVCGTIIGKTGDNLYNCSFFIESSGDEYYSAKRHLFAPGGENKIFCPGDKRLNVRYRG